MNDQNSWFNTTMMAWWGKQEQEEASNDEEAIVPNADSKRQIVSDWQLPQPFSCQDDTTGTMSDDEERPDTKHARHVDRDTVFRRQDASPSNNADESDDTANLKSSLILDERKYQLTHIAPWPFGKIMSIVLMIGCILGLVFAILARRSLSYVHLQRPVEFSPLYNLVDTVGLARVHVCVNKTAVALQTDNTIQSEYPNSDCHVYSLSRDVINDTMWNVARACLGACILLGACVTFVLLSTVWYWQTMNLKPLCLGLLVTYLLQSCSFFMFDSDLCRMNHCKVGAGTAYDIMASIFWFASTLLSVKMDVNMTRAKRRLKRKRMRAIRRIERRKRRLARHNTTATTTYSSRSTSETELDETPPSSPGKTENNARDSPMSSLACLWNGNGVDSGDDEEDADNKGHGLYEA